MKNKLILSFMAVGLGAATATVSAQDWARSFDGAWESVVWSTEGWPLEPPFTAAGRAAQEDWEAHPENDPSHTCTVPLGRIISAPFAHEIIVQDDRVVMLYEYEHQIRRVYMDGREHPNTYPTLMGHSIGHWDGDTLVVDTVALEPGLFRPQGLPYTGNLHLIERYSMAEGGDIMEAELIIDDPEYYSEPWTVKKRYARFEAEIPDYECIVRQHVELE